MGQQWELTESKGGESLLRWKLDSEKTAQADEAERSFGISLWCVGAIEPVQVSSLRICGQMMQPL